MKARGVLFVLFAVLFALVPASAFAYSNGAIPGSALAPIQGGTNHTGQSQPAYLLRGSISASWNTMNLCAAAQGNPLSPGPSTYSPAATAYRSLHIQFILRRQLGSNAAIPGHSNHGDGAAIDLRNLSMRAWIDHNGRRFGWVKAWSDAPWEWWHLHGLPSRVGFHRPDPGSSFRFPNLQKGSGGACQASAVKELQRRLGLAQDGEFGRGTRAAVKAFQKRHHLKPDGRVGSNTWLVLRKVGREVVRNPRTVANNLPHQKAPMAGQDVKAMQGLLNARFRERHLPRRVRTDGVTGKAFTAAVRRFQQLVHLPVTGVVNDRTYAALLKPLVPPTQILAVTGEGTALVARFEGRRLCPYRDVVGIPTQGYGHTAGVHMGDRCWSEAKALTIFRADLDKFGKGVTRLVKVRIGSRQYNALVSLGFNIGLGGLGGSTLMRELNRLHYVLAGDHFKDWNRAGGRAILGLTLRRRAECQLYAKGSATAVRRRIAC